jgi:DNA polymerase
MRTYDIVNAGPNNRFMANGRIVSNSGRTFQPQNLPRPTLKNDVIEEGIAAMKAGVADLLFPNVMELCTSAVRGCLIAAPEKKLVIADLSNIEGRMLAFLAGEQWKLDAFAAFDAGVGHDLYKLAYARSFHKPPESITPDERQIGKVMELALGYNGGIGAFSSMADVYGIRMTEAQAQELVYAWRKAHPAIRSLWYLMEDAVRRAVVNPGKSFAAGKLAARVDGVWLRIRLPSGRYLCYPRVKVDPDGRISYEGITLGRKWARIETYGGKLVENATQAASRDLFAHGMQEAENAGYAVVLHVHDELITETPDSPEYTAAGLAKCMSKGTQWSFGLPVAAAGFETHRYRKG